MQSERATGASPSPNLHRNKLAYVFSRLARSIRVHSYNKDREQSLLKALPWPIHLALCRSPRTYELVVEIRSFVRRMALRRKRQYGFSGIDLGPAHQVSEDGRVEVCTRTHACIEGIRSFVARYPWATCIDVENYRDAWLAGAEWSELCRLNSKNIQGMKHSFE